jgi:hypothetical protein
MASELITKPSDARAMLSVKYNGDVDRRAAAQVLGRAGGRARARRVSPEERRRIASLGGQARRQSLQIAQRIVDNLRYAAAVQELRRPPAVKRLAAFRGPLPDMAAGRR